MPVTRMSPRSSSHSFRHHRRQVELVEARHLGRDDAQHHAGLPALLEDVDAVAHAVGRAVREVGVVVLVEDFALPVAHQVDGEGPDDLGGQRRRVAQRAQVALDAEDRRQPRLEVHVRRAQLPGSAEHVVENLVHGHIVPQHATISPAYADASAARTARQSCPSRRRSAPRCGRRIEGWSRPEGRHAADAASRRSPAATRRRGRCSRPRRCCAPRPSRSRRGAQEAQPRRRQAATALAGQSPLRPARMLVVAARRRPRRLLHRPRARAPVASIRSSPSPAPPSRHRSSPPVAAAPSAARAATVPPPTPPCAAGAHRAQEPSGKRAHVIASAPVPVKAPQAPSPPAVCRTSRSPPTPSRCPSPRPMPTVPHEPTPNPPTPPPAADGGRRQTRSRGHRRRRQRPPRRPPASAAGARLLRPRLQGLLARRHRRDRLRHRRRRPRQERPHRDQHHRLRAARPLSRGARQEWQFPRPVGGDYELIYPFVFAPGS